MAKSSMRLKLALVVVAVGSFVAIAALSSLESRPRSVTVGPPEFLGGNSGPVVWLAFSPDGKTLASADQNGILLRSAADGGPAGIIECSNGRVTAASYSPDGKLIAEATSEGKVEICDVASQKLLAGFAHGDDVLSVAFSPDGKAIAAAGLNNARRRGRNQPPAILVPDAGAISLWDRASGKRLAFLSGLFGQFLQVAFSADGKTLVSLGGAVNRKVLPSGATYYSQSYDWKIMIWDVASAKLVATLGTSTALAVSRDGRLVAGANSDGISLWDLATRKKVASIARPPKSSAQVRFLDFNPDGKTLAAAYEDGTAIIWDIAAGKESLTIQTGKPYKPNLLAVFCPLCYSPDGGRLATSDWTGAVSQWNAQSGALIRAQPASFDESRCVQFSPDGKTLATGDGSSVVLLAARTGMATKELIGHNGTINSIAFGQGGKLLASGSDDKTAKLWETATGKNIATYGGHTGPVLSVSLSPDGKFVASRSADRSVKLWDVATGTSTRPLDGIFGCIAFSPDSRVLAAGTTHNVVRLLDIGSGAETDFGERARPQPPNFEDVGTGPGGQKVREDLTSNDICVSSLAFSPDGKYLAYSWVLDEVQVYKIASGRRTATLRCREPRSYQCVAYSPDGGTITTVQYQNRILLWDARTGENIATISNPLDANGLSFSPDGNMLGTAALGGVLTWKLTYGPPKRSAPVSEKH